MFHARPHQRVEFLPLGAAEQGQSLLTDPLCSAARTPLAGAGTPAPLSAQPPSPLHALPPEQRVVGRVRRGGDGLGRGGIAVNAAARQQGLSGLSCVLVVFHCDGDLRLSHTNNPTLSCYTSTDVY